MTTRFAIAAAIPPVLTLIAAALENSAIDHSLTTKPDAARESPPDDSREGGAAQKSFGDSTGTIAGV